MKYVYCPICGEKLVYKRAGDDGDVPFCRSCDKFWFDSFASCVIVLVYNEYDEIVLCRQPHLSGDHSSFTSGYITPGETAEECAAREVKEELGIEVENLTYAGTVWFEKGDMLMHGYVAYTPKCELVLSEEISSAKWVSYDRAPETMYPDRPGNAMWVLYRKYLEISGKNGS